MVTRACNPSGSNKMCGRCHRGRVLMFWRDTGQHEGSVLSLPRVPLQVFRIRRWIQLLS
ncbi:hypothetical protein GLYMA_01G143000v4 [Glycine max]|uniref:Uncharacterized protein n=1 Tax=Glycine max TaxID=3847 RepID=K7K3U1_SOYBN|nr:hypothetical protein JHK85_001825 [Glycine max]KAG5089163.1 hypothetical protein JHK86_001775 [Glycine max]KAH1163062.1 hypothetical protein GYH30_001554 [Glycine max]KRH76267.1 hypothetical protein GLYMA_01G143000v4 [Glycine max]